jgi:hypothetical protein
MCPTDRWSETRVARRLRSRPLATSAVAPPDSPVIYSHVAFFFPDSAQLMPSQHGAPDSPVRQARAGVGCSLPTLLQFESSFLGSVSST